MIKMRNLLNESESETKKFKFGRSEIHYNSERNYSEIKSKLSTITQRNLEKLETLGYSFKTVYIHTFIQMGNGFRPADKKVSSYYILGKDQNGEDVIYSRKEGNSAGSGTTTLLRKNSGSVKISSLI